MADGSVVLVSGASSGIGAATACAFAALGYRVAVHYHQRAAAAREIAGALGGAAFAADVSDPRQVEAMVAAVEAELGPVDIAVANAGIYEERRLVEVDDELWERTLRVNLGGAFHLARALVPRMRARGGGSIVTVSSELALGGGVGVSHYAAAKAALLGFTRSLARELAPTIRVNAVAPGPVDTPLLPDTERRPEAVAAIPLGRLGRPQDVAQVIVALARASWCTGAVWSINGGVVIQ
jgi:3-oxoacyl-[acyl-carrier protein] reductase